MDLESPFSAEHRLRCITALFVAFRSGPCRGRRGSKQAAAFLLFFVMDGNGRSLAKWLPEPISARLKLWFLIYHSKATGHGFRATASTILNENGFTPDMIERQLAHAERNEVRAAYNHAQYLPERRKIPALVNARLLKPLGNPSQNGAKFFAAADVLEAAKDRSWLVKVTNIISQHWQHQNARKKNHLADLPQNGHALLAGSSR